MITRPEPVEQETLDRIKNSWDDIRPLQRRALDTAFENGKRDIPLLLGEIDRLKSMLFTLGFCPKDGESMPCMTCGAGL